MRQGSQAKHGDHEQGDDAAPELLVRLAYGDEDGRGKVGRGKGGDEPEVVVHLVAQRDGGNGHLVKGRAALHGHADERADCHPEDHEHREPGDLCERAAQGQVAPGVESAAGKEEERDADGHHRVGVVADRRALPAHGERRALQVVEDDE